MQLNNKEMSIVNILHLDDLLGKTNIINPDFPPSHPIINIIQLILVILGLIPTHDNLIIRHEVVRQSNRGAGTKMNIDIDIIIMGVVVDKVCGISAID